MIAALGLLVGIVLGLVFSPDVPAGLEPYLPIAVVAALDAVFGGLRAYLDGIFDDKVFVVSFVSNVVIAALGLLLGILAGLVFAPDVPLGLEPYLPIAVVAALDAVFGALRAFLDGIFDDKVFVVSFVSNVLIAALIVYLGDKLGVGGQLSTGVIVVLGIRIFSNVAAIRRHIFHA